MQIANTLYLPFLLPLTFRPIAPAEVPKYVSRHMDKYRYLQTLTPWQTPAAYCQPWQKSDKIALSIRTDVGPLYLNVYNCYGARIRTLEFVQIRKDRYRSDSFIYELIEPLVSYQEGCYYFTLGVGTANEERYISEPCDIRERHEETFLINYSNTEYRGGIFFETGIDIDLRVHSLFKYTPGSTTTGQDGDGREFIIIDDEPFRKWELKIGGRVGIPDNFIDKLNWVLGCNTLFIEGVQYTKTEESKLEARESKGYPLRWWSIDLYERYPKDSLIYTDNVEVTARATVVLNVDSKGFGPNNVGTAIRQIKVIE